MNEGIPPALMSILMLSFLGTAAVTDLRSRKVPNRLIFAGLAVDAGYALCRAAQIQSLRPVLRTSVGAMLPTAILFLLFHLRMMGAGDIKLFAVIGGLVGPADILSVMVCSFLAGGIWSIILILVRRCFLSRLSYLKSYIETCLKTGSCLPYRDGGIGSHGGRCGDGRCGGGRWDGGRGGRWDGEIPFTIAMLAGFLMYLGGVRI